MELRIAHALGFPVVPDVYIKTARSGGDLFAGAMAAISAAGIWDNVFEVICVISFGMFDTESKEDILNENLGMSSDLTNAARSGVEMMSLDVEILRQCLNVSSRRFVFIKAATTPSFERA
jgi:hypothetical protein